MDITKEYALMCKKAIEIQALNKVIAPQIWLPRQDQLQDMLIGQYKDIYEMIDDFRNSIINIVNNRLKSLEQLWLIFVMKENHNKVWSDKDKDWIKE